MIPIFKIIFSLQIINDDNKSRDHDAPSYQ